MKKHFLFLLAFLGLSDFELLKNTGNHLSAQSAIVIDTVCFNKISFISDLALRIHACDIKHNRTESISKADIVSSIKLLNKELKTNCFNNLEVITAISVYLTEDNQWITLMEWHFSSDKKIDTVERLLKKLEKGRIRHTIYPLAYKWVRCGNKLYVMKFYTPSTSREVAATNVFECITMNMPEKK